MNDLVQPLDSVRAYLNAEKATSTRRGYASSFRLFTEWCEARGLSPMPAEPLTVAQYLADLADTGTKAATIAYRVAAIRYAHKVKGYEPPTNVEAVKAVVRGIRNTIGVAVVQKAPATADAIAEMVDRTDDTLIGKRDRALLLLGFAAAMRRSEIVALNVDDLELSPEGVRIKIRRSKTDQAGKGHVVAVPRGSRLRPVKAVEDWLQAAKITEGPLFRGVAKGGRLLPDRMCDRQVARIVKRYAEKAGLDPQTFAGHSLRAGFVTSALETGADILKVMDVTRHTEVRTLKAYDRRAKAFRNHAGRGFL